jgi:hypothetical protein
VISFGDSCSRHLIWGLLFTPYDLGTPVHALCSGDSCSCPLLWGLLFTSSDLGTPVHALCFGDSCSRPLLWGLVFTPSDLGTRVHANCFRDYCSRNLLWGLLFTPVYGFITVCHFKSHMKSSFHSLIPFLQFLLNHLRLPTAPKQNGVSKFN